MSYQQGGGRDQDQAQGHQGGWVPWNPAGHQEEEDQARQERGQGQGHQDYWAPDDQGQGAAAGGGQGQRAQGPNAQELRLGPTRQAILATPEKWRFREEPLKPEDLQVAQVVDALNAPAPQPGQPESIQLTMIVPGPYKKFPVRVSLTVHQLTVDIRKDYGSNFPPQVAEFIWGPALIGRSTEPKVCCQLCLGQGAIWAVARCNASLTLFFENHETRFRAMVVLVPRDNIRCDQRNRLAVFGRRLCRWVWPDANLLMHYDPKEAFPAYRWLMEQARADNAHCPVWPVPEEEQSLLREGLFDQDLHYLYRPGLRPLYQNVLYRHFKYELKKALAIVANRLFTRLESSNRRIHAERADRRARGHKPQDPQIDIILANVNYDLAWYQTYLQDYRLFYPVEDVNWDDPSIRNDVWQYVPLPEGPTVWAQGQYVRWINQSQVEAVNRTIDYTHPAFQAHPMRVYQSLVDRWNVVERIEFHDDDLHVYMQQQPKGKSVKYMYTRILYVRHCAIGGASFSIHQHGRWGHLHFECALSNEITALRYLLLSRLHERRIAFEQVVPERNANRQIGPLAWALFPYDATIEPELSIWEVEPVAYWRVVDVPKAYTGIARNYVALACRLINKLAIRLADSVDREGIPPLGTDPQVVDMWQAYWNGRERLLKESQLNSNLPHLVQFQVNENEYIYKLRPRWVYALFDAPNGR